MFRFSLGNSEKLSNFCLILALEHAYQGYALLLNASSRRIECENLRWLTALIETEIFFEEFFLFILTTFHPSNKILKKYLSKTRNWIQNVRICI